MHDLTKIDECIFEAERFIKKAKILSEKMKQYPCKYDLAVGHKDVSAVKRSSLDLSRILAEMRNKQERDVK